MSKSLLELLPRIVATGRQEAVRTLDNLDAGHLVVMQTREWVSSAKGGGMACAQPNRLIRGDSLLAMAALLAGDDMAPSQRGKLDLIHIDLPFHRADGWAGAPAQPSGWHDPVASYLAMLTPRLFLMRELLRENGSIYLGLDAHMGHYSRVVVDEVFGYRRPANIRFMPGDEDGMRRAPPRGLLLEQAIEAAAPDAVVADFCDGGGAASLVAERLGRRWLIFSADEASCIGLRKRLVDQDARPFLYLEIGGCCRQA